MKFLCSFLVAAIHITPLSSFYESRAVRYIGYGISYYLARIAVPFYFASAGFFLLRKIDLDDFDPGVFKTYIFKNLRLLGLWTVLLFQGSVGHLWYMGGLVAAVFFMGVLLYYKVPLRKMIIPASVLYLIGLLGDSYYGLLSPLMCRAMNAYFVIFGTTRNGIFMGFPFLLLGAVVAAGRRRLKLSTSLIGFVLSMAVFLIEVVVLTKLRLPRDHNMYISLIPVEFFLLSSATTIRIKDRAIYRRMRRAGIVVYFSHLFALYWVNLGVYCVRRFFGVELLTNSLIEYSLTVVLAALSGFCVERLSHKERLGLLRYLYS